MMDYTQTLYDICVELVNHKDHLEVRELPSADDDELVLCVYADTADISKLIGRKGIMANSIRRLMSVPGRLNDQRLDIKFESYGD